MDEMINGHVRLSQAIRDSKVSDRVHRERARKAMHTAYKK